MITNPIGPFANVEAAVEWAQTPGNIEAAVAVYTDNYGRVYVQDAEAAQTFHAHQISRIIEPTKAHPTKPTSAYLKKDGHMWRIVDEDGRDIRPALPTRKAARSYCSVKGILLHEGY